MKSKTKSVIRQ